MGTSVIPRVVYHYTSMDAMLGIVEGCIWATTILYLKALDGMINQSLSHSIRFIEEMESAPGAIASDRDRVDLLRAEFEMRAGRTKHKSFMHEREYRLIALLFAQNELVSFPASRSTLVPYLKMRLPGPDQANRSSPRAQASTVQFIDNVTIGPTLHPTLSEDAVLGLLRSKGFNPSVETSSIPFRDW